MDKTQLLEQAIEACLKLQDALACEECDNELSTIIDMLQELDMTVRLEEGEEEEVQ